MTLARCPMCGRANSHKNTFCEGCGQRLLSSQQHEERSQELRDYEEYRKRYSMLAIIFAIFALLLLCLAVRWLVWAISPMLGTEFQPTAVMLECAAPAIMLFVFLLAVLPMIYGRWSIRRRYRWTGERMQSLNRELRSLPKESFGTAQAPVQRIQGPPIALLVILFGLVALVYAHKYTDLKPLDSIISLLGIENAQIIGGKNQSTPTVRGRYDCHVEAKNYPGVRQAEQTWSYVFHADGTYTTYLEGSQQYSGTWSQSGNTITLNVPAITGLSAAYSFQAKVSRDGNSFTSGKRTWTKVK